MYNAATTLHKQSETLSLASFAASPFSVLCHTVNKIKYGKNWRNKERKNEPSKKKESLPR